LITDILQKYGKSMDAAEKISIKKPFIIEQPKALKV
jgi:hypothetical protein